MPIYHLFTTDSSSKKVLKTGALTLLACTQVADARELNESCVSLKFDNTFDMNMISLSCC